MGTEGRAWAFLVSNRLGDQALRPATQGGHLGSHFPIAQNQSLSTSISQFSNHILSGKWGE